MDKKGVKPLVCCWTWATGHFSISQEETSLLQEGVFIGAWDSASPLYEKK